MRILRTVVPIMMAVASITEAQSAMSRYQLSATVGTSLGSARAACVACGNGVTTDASFGVALGEKFVAGGRYTRWNGSDAEQSMSVILGTLQFYTNPDADRVKPFLVGGLGRARLSMLTFSDNASDRFDARSLPAMTGGAGLDIRVWRRLAVTPFVSYSTTLGGASTRVHCTSSNFDAVYDLCLQDDSEARTFNLKQFGIGLGWR